MKHNLLAFLFFAILLAVVYHLALAHLYAGFFSLSRAWQTNWMVPFILVPALLLALLAWGMGFFRPSGARWGDAAVLAMIGAIVYLTLDASYACGSGCF